MKKIVFRSAFAAFALLAAALILSTAFFSCMSATTVRQGLENVAYLEIMGDKGKYQTVTSTKSGETEFLHLVQVVIDEDEAFDAEVNSIKNRAVENEFSYKIATGTHTIEISFEGRRVLRTQIFVSAGQTKVISLP